MPNPYVVRVDRNAFWNQYRSTPIPALQMRRPPELVERSLYKYRWPETGPYQGVSFPPFAFNPDPEALPVPPIQEPVVGLPMAPSDVDIQGITELAEEGVVGLWPLVGAASAAVCTMHGYRRNNGSVGWAIAWGIGGWLLPVVLPVVAVAQGFGEPAGLGGFGAWEFWVSGPFPDAGAKIFISDKEGQRHRDWGKKFNSKNEAMQWGRDQGFTEESIPFKEFKKR
jgi:hypothetical protein